jgi:hypothetical protein
VKAKSPLESQPSAVVCHKKKEKMVTLIIRGDLPLQNGREQQHVNYK